MKKVCIYHNYIPRLGGIESAVYNLAKSLDRKGYKVTIAFRNVETGDSLLKYAQVADIVNVQEEDVECDICLIASNHDIPARIKAKKFIQWVHSDYTKYELHLKNIGEISEYICVSKYAEKVIRKLEGIKNTRVVYNLLDDDFGKNKKMLKLVTNSRVSPEKGFDRMLALAKVLKEKGINFVWIVCGDNSHSSQVYTNCVNKFKDIPEVYFVGYKPDITPMLSICDYLVQLSDFEGCPYSVLEALKMEKPCIVTSWGGADELIQDGVNGYILPMQVDKYSGYVDKIVNEIPKFKHKPLSTIDNWIKIIEKEK